MVGFFHVFFLLKFFGVHDFYVVVTERGESGEDIGIPFDVDDTLDSAFHNKAFANAARVRCDIECCAMRWDIRGCCFGNGILFGTHSIADFPLRAGGDLAAVSNAAYDPAVVFAVRGIVVTCENFSIFHNERANLCSNASGAFCSVDQCAEKFEVDFCERHAIIVASTGIRGEFLAPKPRI